METKLKLDHIFVAYQKSNSVEYTFKIDFKNSLHTLPLSSIEEWIYTKYNLNNDRDLNLMIKHGVSSEKWNVFEDDKLFFPFIFTSDDERDFIDIFEEQLKQELEKQQTKNPYSFPSPDYDVEVSM